MNRNFSFVGPFDLDQDTIKAVMDRLGNYIGKKYITINELGSEISLILIKDYLASHNLFSANKISYDIEKGIVDSVENIQISLFTIDKEYSPNETDKVSNFITSKMTYTWNHNKDLKKIYQDDFNKFYIRIKFVINAYKDIIKKLETDIDNYS